MTIRFTHIKEGKYKLSAHIFKLGATMLVYAKLQVSCIIPLKFEATIWQQRSGHCWPGMWDNKVETENMVSSWINRPDPSQDDYSSMCWSAAACRHTVLLFHVLLFPPLTQKALLSLPPNKPVFSIPPLRLCSASGRRLGECWGLSVVLCCALFWSGPNAVVLCFLNFNLGHACSLSARRWFLVSLGLCGCVCVCDFFFFHLPLFFLSPECERTQIIIITNAVFVINMSPLELQTLVCFSVLTL